MQHYTDFTKEGINFEGKSSEFGVKEDGEYGSFKTELGEKRESPLSMTPGEPMRFSTQRDK